jgi:FkbM family methyltransferase
MITRFRPIVERYPFLAFAYRTIRDSWVMNSQQPKITPEGFRLIGRSDMQEGSFEPEQTAVIKQSLKKCEVFIDVGANIGYYTCLARSLGIYTVAIEPLSENLLYLYTNLEENGWPDVEVWPLGVGNKPKLTTLYGGGTGASLVKEWAESSELYRRTIPTSTLDIILGERFAGKRLLIKVDIEGGEFESLQGAAKTLARTPSPIWVMEICLTEHFPTGINPHFEEIFRMFWENGYEARIIGEDNRLVTLDDVKRWVRNRERDFGYISYSFGKLTSKDHETANA